MPDYLQLLALTDDEFPRIDSVEMNLLVAKSIPALANLDVPRYQRLADEWAEAVRVRLTECERVFRQRSWSGSVSPQSDLLLPTNHDMREKADNRNLDEHSGVIEVHIRKD